MNRPVVSVLLFAATALLLAAQPTPPAPPAPPAESAQFDFWLGEWEVVGKAGKVVGRSRIEKISSGWGMLENWESSGFPGKSINAWNPAKKCWQQFWVGSGGGTLELAGGLSAQGSMVLSDRDTRPAGAKVINRITWTPNPDGSVRQHWETSEDDGVTWKTSFDGLYRRKTSQP